jgi:hypothetical protein
MEGLYNLNTYMLSNKDENNKTNDEKIWFSRRKINTNPLKYEITKTYKPLIIKNIKEIEQIISVSEWYNMRLSKNHEYKIYGDMDGIKINIDEAIEKLKLAYEKTLNIKIKKVSLTKNDNYKKQKEGLSSYHFVFPEFYANIEEQDAIKKKINEELKKYNFEIDPSVYCEKWFRLPNQKKGFIMGKGYETGCHKVIKGELKDFILDYITEKMTKINYTINDEEIKKTKNIKHKDIKNENVKHENKKISLGEEEKINILMIDEYLNILDIKKRSHWKEWSEIMLMLRNYGLIEQAHTFCRKMKNYNEAEIDKIFSTPAENHDLGIGSLKYWAKQDNPYEYEKINEKYTTYLKYDNIYDDILLKDYSGKISMIENKARISNEAIQKIIKSDTSIIMSSTGSGKSTMIKKYIIDANPQSSILSVSCIRSLARAQEVDFSLTSYLNERCSNRTIISYEQLVKRSASKYDIVILDEVTSLLKHLFSPTMKQKRDSHACLINLIKSCKKLYASDAILTDAVYDFIRSIRTGDIFFYRNIHKHWNNINIKISSIEESDENNEHERIEYFLQPLYEKIKGKETCAIISDSKSYINIAHEIISSWIDKNKIMTKEDEEKYIGIFTADHGNLKNINDAFFTNKLIMFSPKIVFGVNISEKVVYNNNSIFVIYKGESISSMSMLQQIGRFRGAIKNGTINLLFVRRDYINKKNKYITIEDLKQQELVKINDYIKSAKKINQEMEIIKEMGCNYDAEKCEFTFNDKCLFSRQYMREMWYDTLFNNNKSQCLISLLDYYGYSIEHTVLKIEKKEKSKQKRILKNNDKEKVQKNCIKYINNELDMSCEDYELISERVEKRLQIIDMSLKDLHNKTTNEIEKNKIEMLRDFIVNEKVYQYCIQSYNLFINDEKLLKKYGQFTIYKIIEMNNKNPATMSAIREMEKICGINRFDLDKIKSENINDVQKYVENNKMELSDALYGFSNISKKLRLQRINQKVKKINSICDIKNLFMKLYNQYGNLFYKKKISDKIIEKKHVRIYDIVKNEDVFNHIKIYREELDKINKNKKLEKCMFEDETENKQIKKVNKKSKIETEKGIMKYFN